jgi:phage tail-like protein
MRGYVPDLASPHPLGPSLPPLYLEDDFAQRLLLAFDDVLAPIHSSLDNLSAYLDPALAPDDFVDWLGEWVGAVMDATWEVERRRASVARAAELYGSRGTARGLAAQLELVTGGTVEIVENGGTTWSLDPSTPLPGTAEPNLSIRVVVADPAAVDGPRLDRLVAAAKPAHVPHSVEVVRAAPAVRAAARDASGGPQADAT